MCLRHIFLSSLLIFRIGFGIQPFDMPTECANIGGVMIDIFPYSCFTKVLNSQVDLTLVASENCNQMDNHYTMAHLPWLGTQAQTLAMMEALPYFNYATSGMFQTNNDDEPGGNWYYVGKDVSVGLFGPLPNQTGGSGNPHRFDIWTNDDEPSDANSPVGNKCEGLHEDTTCMIGSPGHAQYTLSYTYANICDQNGGDPYTYSQAICQYDYRFPRQVFKRQYERGMLKDVVGVRSLPGTKFVIECGKACSEAPICPMYSYDTSSKMCRISFIPIDFIDDITETPSNHQHLYVRTLL